MLISVILPHLNQEAQLRAGLAALHAQEGVKGRVEIIVVDNGSRSLPREVCAAWSDVRLAVEATPGPGPARNQGANLAGGDVLAFIDADCRAHPGWLATIEAAFGEPATMIVGGDVRVGYADPARPTALECYENIYAYRNRAYIAEGYSGTGNLATRPEVLARVGPFGGIGIAEDRDWGFRAGALGYRIDYVPEMIVWHPARKSFAELARKWDRHIAHSHAEITAKPFGLARWLGRAVAVTGSPFFEIPKVLRSRRISGARSRLLAFRCLCRIRLYRGWRMLRIAFARDAGLGSRSWNRG